jgi:AcrR family transcriptional regulator
MARRYELKERARTQEATRCRIVDAALALHEEVGPARTTVVELARRAGVGRVTVYNHFPDDAALLAATTGQWLAEHPPPDPAAWADVKDPGKRLRRALEQLYGYYRANEAMLAHLARDRGVVDALASALDGPAAAREDAMRDVLLAGRKLRGGRERRTRATIGLALSFATWQRLTTDEGFGDKGAAKLMVRTIEAH